MFLSRLNKTNKGCKKILPVSGSFYAVSVKFGGKLLRNKKQCKIVSRTLSRLNISYKESAGTASPSTKQGYWLGLQVTLYV